MSDVVVVGDGPAGLSAAVLVSKNGLETRLFDTDDTWTDDAHLFNYTKSRKKPTTSVVR